MPTSSGCRSLCFLLGLAALLAAAAPVQAQYPYPGPVRFNPYLPPPLWVKVGGPAGLQVTFYRGTLQPETLTVPFTVGLRPGYVYRVRVGNIPRQVGLTAYPTLEVRGSLQNESRFQAKDYPAALNFAEDDFHPGRGDSLVTRVIALERSETALPEATTPDNPLELRVEAGADPVRVAVNHGIPLLIMRLGQRFLSEQELQAQGIPGTVVLPGDSSQTMPPVAPYLPWACPALYDPRLGAAGLSSLICLPDGGTTGPTPAVDVQGRLQGLQPSNTVAEYEDSQGRRQVACSNRVCICVPRYLVFRGELILERNQSTFGPGSYQIAQVPVVNKADVPVVTQYQNIQVEGVAGKQAPSSASAAQATVIVGQIEGVNVTARLEGTRGVSSTCLTGEKELPDRPLCVIKWPDRNNALIGDVITFTLKYTNQGGHPVRNIVLSDSLVSRFEYVPGSARSDHPANFTTQSNDVGSLILRWQITEELPPGQSGLVTFQVRIR